MGKLTSASNHLLIKGYLPVRVRFLANVANTGEEEEVDDDDNNNHSDNDEEHVTFFYVKEHQPKTTIIPSTTTTTTTTTTRPSSSSSMGDTASNTTHQPTLFVANAPSFPPIDTATLLHALLGRFGHIKRVTVVPNPRSSSTTTNATTVTTLLPISSDEKDLQRLPQHGPSYFEHVTTDRFAHVVFATPKDLKQCYRALTRIMDHNDKNSNKDVALVVTPVERQTLIDALQKQRRHNSHEHDDGEDGDDDGKGNHQNNNPTEEPLQGIHKVLDRYRRSCRQFQREGRQALLEECNAIMEAYEQAEQARLRAMSSEPDEDGFITVSHSATPATSSMQALTMTESNEGSTTPGRPRHHMSKGRSRKRRKSSSNNNSDKSGATAKDDFYRFQTKAKRKQDVQDLRTRFQQDLQRIQKIKETKGGFKPFG